MEEGVQPLDCNGCNPWIGSWTARMSEQVDDIRNVIFGTLRTMLPGEKTITESTNITEDLGLDSVAMMDFVMEIEDKLDISVPLDKIAEVETLGDLIATVHRLKAAA